MIQNCEIRLEFSTGRAPWNLSTLSTRYSRKRAPTFHGWISATPLPRFGSCWRRTTLTPAENEQLKNHFLLSRERLLKIIAATGRPPHVAGGGELVTFDATHNLYYPQLWVAQNDQDLSRFDRFHMNIADDGTGVNEVGQLLAGGNLVIRKRLPDRAVVTLSLQCSADGTGWLVTYDGGKPHIGSFSQASPATKVLVQVIGPAIWNMRYEE